MNTLTELIRQQHNNQPIVIYGLGREGLSTYTFLRKYLPKVVLHLVDDQDHIFEKKPWRDLDLRDYTHFYQKGQYYDLLQSSISENKPQKMFKTAGIPFSNDLVKLAQSNSIEISSNTQLCFELVEKLNKLTNNHVRITTIGVTGTKGKSTTTSLVHHILTQTHNTSVLGGNIGTAPLSALEKLLQHYQSVLETDGHNSPTPTVCKTCHLTLELSSHQLQGLKVSPNLAILLNITPEHLDYYSSFEEYAGAKSNITRYQQRNDVAIFNQKNQLPTMFSKLSSGNKESITEYEIEKVKLSDFKIKGEHNKENIALALKAAENLGVLYKNAYQAAQSFPGLPHRLEFVANVQGVACYNDSLATTPVATIAALTAFPNKKITLICGGYDRGLEYKELAQSIKLSSATMVLGIGATGKKIVSSLENNPNLTVVYSGTLKQAVTTALEHLKSTDILLMSPASASFDQFTDYAERGNAFRKIILDQASLRKALNKK